MVPELLLGFALDLRHDELHILGHKLALLPRHWLASVSARPNLFSISVSLPESDTVLLGHVPALGQQLRVGDGLLALCAALLDELLRRKLRLSELLRFLPRLALLVRDNLAFSFGDILTDVLGPIRALLHKDRLTGLGLPLHPYDGLVGGHVHAELLVVQVNGLAGLGRTPVTVLIGKVCVSSSPLLLRAVFQLGCNVQRLVWLP